MLAALGEVKVELRHLREEVSARPSRAEVTGLRRLAIFGVVTLILFVIQITDLHTEACGPGHRSEAVVELIRTSIRDKEPLSADDISNVIEGATPGWVCGITFPTHAHDGHTWPEKQHIAGIIMYLAVLLGLGVWVHFGFDENRYINRKRELDGSDHTAEPDVATEQADVGGEGSTSG